MPSGHKFLIFLICLGPRTETSTRVNGSDDNEGVSGLKVLGVRELTYKMAFLALHVVPCNAKVMSFSCPRWSFNIG